jgi:hypothetical protein
MSSDSRFLWARAAGVASVVALAIVPLVSGCPGELANPEDFEDEAVSGGTGTGTGVVDPCNGLLTNSCALANCHDAESSSVDLSLAGREERLVDQAGRTCPGNYIDTANPEASLLYTKCAEPQPACGSPMPLAQEPLDQEELSCLLAYVQSFAGGGSTGASSSASGASSSASSAASSSSGGAE